MILETIGRSAADDPDEQRARQTGQGFGLLIIALGAIETVGIFGMVFGLAILNKAG